MADRSADALLNTAYRMLQDGKPLEAERMFKAVLSVLGEETNALTHLSSIAQDRGALDDAQAYAERAIRADTTNPAAYHHLGLVYQARGDANTAAGFFGRAVELAPGHLGALTLFARNLAEAGAVNAAADAYRKLVSLAPRDANATFEAAVFFQRVGGLQDAAALYLRCIALVPAGLEAWTNLAQCGADPRLAVRFNARAVAIVPDSVELATNLGHALLAAGEREGAIGLFSQILAALPNHPQALFNLGLAHGGANPDAALALYLAALAQAPEFINAWINLGGQMVLRRRFQNAAWAYARAMLIDPFADIARVNAALALIYDGEAETPSNLMMQSLALRRATSVWPIARQDVPAVPDDISLRACNALKLRHDVEQFRYLQAIGRFGAELDPVIEAYEETRREIEAAQGQATVALPPQLRERIGALYNRVIHVRMTPAVEGSAVSAEIDRDAVVARYAEPPGVTWVDNLLTPTALAELRAFCLESTIWSDFSHNFENGARGYLGAFVTDGFACPLLFQIAEDMRRALPEIFRDYPLMQLWAFKGDAPLQGLEIHADAAAVNVNFWITPDDANLDPETGGLTVWTAEAPADWTFDKFNNDKAAMTALIEAPGVRRIDVAYRQNRALIFNSDLFHGTQPVTFKPGYENRRINITMLFGTRDKDWQRLS